jgi:chromosome segregation ATPase
MTTTFSVDHRQVHDSFSQWQAEQDALDAQVAESIAALEAYQSHLDDWQRELATEREELHRLRTAHERDQALAEPQSERLDAVQRELNEAHQKISSLTTALLARTEELRELDRMRVAVDHELTAAQAREQGLIAELEAERQRAEAGQRQPIARASRPAEQAPRDEKATSTGPSATSGQPAASRPSAVPNQSANPVLGSVMEQFGKLRQQRSLGRQSNSKPGG